MTPTARNFMLWCHRFEHEIELLRANFAASRGQAGALNITVGIVAFAVLGGLAAFATVGFAQVLFGALWQAMNPPPTTGPAGDQTR